VDRACCAENPRTVYPIAGPWLIVSNNGASCSSTMQNSHDGAPPTGFPFGRSEVSEVNSEIVYLPRGEHLHIRA